MRSCCRFLAVISLSISALASDLTVRVLDPRSAAVPGAQVELFSAGSDRAIAISNTTGQGTVHFREVPTGDLRVRVMAPGFGEHSRAVVTDAKGPINLTLAMAK